MDAASLALSIAALYSTCRDCYDFFITVKSAEAESSAHVRELEIQQSILKAWGFHWQIQQSSDSNDPEQRSRTGRIRTKLHEYLLSNRFKAEGVFKTLSALADTLSNQEKLVERYGIQFRPVHAIQNGSHPLDNNAQLAITDATIEDVQPVVSEVKNRLSMLSKFKWALKDRDNFKKLIVDLKSHSDSLYRLCPENAFESMNIYFILECLAKQESPADLRSTSRFAVEHAETDEQSSVRDGYKLLASAATLKASVNETKNKTLGNHALPKIDEKQPKMSYLGKGLALYEGQVVYVEMRDYRGPPLDLTPEQKQRLKKRRDRARMFTPANGYLSSGGHAQQRESFYGRNRGGEGQPRFGGHDEDDDEDDEDDDEDDAPIEIIRPANPNLRALIANFFNTFKGTNMREGIYGLDIAGMIDHTEGEHKSHCSILYRLPGTIGIQTRERPAENLKLRAPVTLESLLMNRANPGIRSTLGSRFKLARKLVRAVCLLHSSGWLHKNIRAESVMFFPEHVSTLAEDQYEIKIEINVSQPILMGYIFSRPDDVIVREAKTDSPTLALQTHQGILSRSHQYRNSYHDRSYDYVPNDDDTRHYRRTRRPTIYGRDMLGKVLVPSDTKETNISGFTLDYYQHPAKHANLNRQYRHAYDVYSLGILLIEIGLWEKVREMRSEYVHETYQEEDHYERRRWICREYLERLRWACGDTYADVVLSCLMIDSSDDEIAKASERELCARLVANLEGCQA